MKKNGKKQIRAYSLGGVLLVIVLVVIIVLLVVGGISFNIDSCEDIPVPSSVLRKSAAPQYSDVITDLSKDETFAAEDYPEREGDYSLAVIQIAESVDGELFVYAYAPAGAKVTATEIRFSTAINESFKPVDYVLELVNYSGTLAKYVVEDFAVKSDAVRYYDIVCIFRRWLDGVDIPPIDGQTVSSVSYPVGATWTACTISENVTYSMVSTEVIAVTDKRVGRIVYPKGSSVFGWSKCESHYVAFSTDRDIERLMEAELTYISTPYYYTSTSGYSYGENTTVPLMLTGEQTGGNNGGIFTHRYKWKRIQTVHELLNDKDVTLTDEAKKDLSDMAWVLRFAETEYTSSATSTVYIQNGTHVSDVTILRLKFETDGVVYNLGVVDNKQTSSPIPDGENNPTIPWWERLFSVFKNIFSWLVKAFSWCGMHWKTLLIVSACIVGFLLVLWLIVTLVRKILKQ
ncbi:MAG: hypothetical protein HFE48_07445 [Clostridia bacterium]|nr:hypothetical protein [Clostridia bacterium]